MKLLAQGKTNWRYILIAGVLVAIICGTIWLFFSSYRKMAPTKVSPDFMCSKNVAIAGYVGSGDYDKILPPGIKYVICSDELTSLGIKFLQPLREDTRAIPSCVPLETSQEFSIDGSKPISEGPEITINGTVQCIDNRKIKNPDCELSSLGCQLVMWLKESAPEKETADWKTYRNEDYGFEVKYPKEWSVGEHDNGVTFYAEEFDELEGYIGIVKLENPRQLSAIDYVKEYRTGLIEEYLGEVVVGGANGLRVLERGMALHTVVYLSNKTDIYMISIVEGSKYEDVFNQILSSFRFVGGDEAAN